MSQADARRERVGTERTAGKSSAGGARGWRFRGLRRRGSSLVALLVAAALVATLAPGARAALVEAASYLAPLALFVGVLATVDGAAAG